MKFYPNEKCVCAGGGGEFYVYFSHAEGGRRGDKVLG